MYKKKFFVFSLFVFFFFSSLLSFFDDAIPYLPLLVHLCKSWCYCCCLLCRMCVCFLAVFIRFVNSMVWSYFRHFISSTMRCTSISAVAWRVDGGGRVRLCLWLSELFPAFTTFEADRTYTHNSHIHNEHTHCTPLECLKTKKSQLKLKMRVAISIAPSHTRTLTLCENNTFLNWKFAVSLHLFATPLHDCVLYFFSANCVDRIMCYGQLILLKNIQRVRDSLAHTHKDKTEKKE